jgi:O-antigen/teichoic acid export membrane protein
VEGPVAPDILDTEQAGPTAIRGGLLRIAGYVLSVALSVASAALLLRYLGPRDFGDYATVLAIVTIVGGFTEAGMTNIGLREWTVQEPRRRARMLRHLLGIRLSLTLAGSCLALGFGAAVGYGGVLVAGIALGAVGLVLQVLQTTYSVPLQSELRLGWVTALDLVRQVVAVAAIVALVVAGAELLPFFAVPIAAAVAALIATVLLVRGRLALRPDLDLAEWRRLGRMTLPYAVATTTGLLYVYMAIVLMSLVASDLETGYFAASFRVFIVVGAVPGLVVASAFPILARAARDDRSRLSYAVQRLFDVSLAFGAGMALALVVGAEIAIDVVAGAEFEPSVDVLRILGAALLATFLLATWSYALLALARYRALVIVNAIALVVSAALTLTLGPTLGAEGAAIATLCGESALALAAGIAVVRAHRDLRLSLQALPPTLVAAAAGAALALVPGLPDLARVALASVGYGAVLAALGGVPAELREAIAGRIRRR